MKELTYAEHLSIKRCRQKNDTLKDIADRIGITKKQLRNYCKKNNL